MVIMTNHHLLVLISIFFEACLAQNSPPPPPSLFIFGDSLVDSGNNNFILTLAKANFHPNGVDFGKPTGRFTNGRAVVDFIGQELGMKNLVPPYLDPTTVGDIVFQGVNYASGASGILNETGKIYGGRINMDAQLDNFANTRQYIISRIGFLAASEFFRKSLFCVTTGSNDFINNYLTPSANSFLTPQLFIDTLIFRFRLQLTRLYDLGARKIVVNNLPPIGCIPNQRDKNPFAGNSCVAFPNQLAMSFNNKLKNLIIELRSNLVGSKFVYADAYRVAFDIIQNFQAYGFENSNSACCRLGGKFGGLIPCLAMSIVCPYRSKYVFWDSFHPTEAANAIIAKRFMDGDFEYIYPMNIRQLFYSA